MKLLPKTTLSESAKASRWRHIWIIDILIALLLFLIAQLIELSVLAFPALFTLLAPSFPGYTEDVASKFDTFLLLLQLLATISLIIVCILYCTKMEHRSVQSIGFCGISPIIEYIKGFFLGAFLFTSAWLICLLFGVIEVHLSTKSISPIIVLFLVAFCVQGLSEEVFCRGFLMQSLSSRYPPIVAIISNSIVFACLHLLNNSISALALLNLFLFGIFASLYFWKRGNIWGIAAAHSSWNFVQGNFFGINVSGINIESSIFTTSLKDSGSFINGGGFGLEGGIAVTIILLIASGIILVAPARSNIVISE